MYEGTLYGHWEAIVTFQQMVVLCDADGTIDMTPVAIAARTSIPVEIILKGIEVLSSPDPHSRTPDREGRRIELIDDHRPWGWTIVNHEKYKLLVDADTVREQNRIRQKKHRQKQSVTDDNGVSRYVTANNACNAKSRHTDTDTDTDTDTKRKTAGKPALSAKERKTKLPENFGTQWTDSMQAWLDEHCDSRSLETRLAHFIGYARANGKKYVDWEQAFQNAVRDDWAKIKSVEKAGKFDPVAANFEFMRRKQ